QRGSGRDALGPGERRLLLRRRPSARRRAGGLVPPARRPPARGRIASRLVTSDVHSLATAHRERGPLEGIGIVVTRPLRQAAVLATRIATLGGVPIIWPAIVILPPPDRVPLERAHAALADYDIAIF